ncbi:MarR family transcriptional regulator [Alcaligenaceae bacterium CGII-47]|nr:MarR family transcriptional regulator [Alcaligenaceae bacterium CGII-47]
MSNKTPAPQPSPVEESDSPYYQACADSLRQDNNLGLLIKRVHALMHRVIDHKVMPLDLTAMQWRPLLLIGHKGIDTPAELARFMQVDTGAMTRTLDRLEAKGFLARQRCLDDRRVVKVTLTPAGTAVIEQILPLIADTLNLHLQGFSRDEIQMLFGLLQRLTRNGERYFDSLPTPEQDTHPQR